jgi:3-oxoadipate enol-lactonase
MLAAVVRANGIDVRYVIDGPTDGPVVVFSNSLTSDLGIWNEVAEALSGQYRILRYDLRGHGGTGATPGEYSIALLGQDLLALLDALHFKKVHLVGLSIGGMIAQFVAATAPHRFLSLVLCATSSEGVPAIWEQRLDIARSRGFDELIEPTLLRWYTPETHERDPKLIASTRRMISETSTSGYIGSAAALRDLHLTRLLAQITAPTLLVAGQNDASTPVAGMEAMCREIPDARLVVLPGAAHLLALERPKELVGLIGGFLERVRGSVDEKPGRIPVRA